MAKRRAKGEGTVFKEKSGYWCAEITLPDGKKKRKRSKSQQAVKDWLLDQRKTVQSGLYVPNEKLLFGDYLESFLTDVAEPNLKPKTVYSYRWLARDHIKPNLGHIPLVQLKPNHLQSLYKKKLEEGLSKRSVQHMHAVIRRSLNQAPKWGLIHQNPASLVSAPRPDKRPPQRLPRNRPRCF